MSRATLAALCAVAALGAACGPRDTSPETRGGQVFNLHCVTCHSLEPGVVIVGPSLAGVVQRAEDAGSDPRSYLEQAVLEPGAEVVPGFQNLMPVDFDRRLSPDELDALIAFLLTLD